MATTLPVPTVGSALPGRVAGEPGSRRWASRRLAPGPGPAVAAGGVGGGVGGVGVGTGGRVSGGGAGAGSRGLRGAAPTLRAPGYGNGCGAVESAGGKRKKVSINHPPLCWTKSKRMANGCSPPKVTST